MVPRLFMLKITVFPDQVLWIFCAKIVDATSAKFLSFYSFDSSNLGWSYKLAKRLKTSTSRTNLEEKLKSCQNFVWPSTIILRQFWPPVQKLHNQTDASNLY